MDGAYVINLDEYKLIGTYQIALYVSGDSVTYFDNFGAEYIPKEIKRFIGNKNIITDIYRIQANHSIMYEYFYIGLIDFMLEVCQILPIYFLLRNMDKMIE